MNIDRNTAGKPHILGQMNRKLILDSLRKDGAQSRVDLGKRLGLSFPAVSANVDELLAQGYIVPCDTTVGGPGRRAALFAYNADWGYVFSIDLGRSHIRCMLSDAVGKSLQISYFKLKATSEAGAIAEIDDCFRGILSACGVSPEKVRAVSVGVPGVVKGGQMQMAPFLNEALRNYRLDRFFEEKYGIRVSTQNSVKLSAIAEKWQGAAVDYADIVYVDCAVGLGSAVILNGELVTGRDGAAGEIGYMLPGIHFRRGTFEESGLLEKVMCASELEMLIRRAGGEDTEVQQRYLEDSKDYLALALVNLAAMINPEIIIVGGRLGSKFMEHYASYYESFLAAHVPFPPLLRKSQLGENAALIGAAAYALRQIHEQQAEGVR